MWRHFQVKVIVFGDIFDIIHILNLSWGGWKIILYPDSQVWYPSSSEILFIYIYKIHILYIIYKIYNVHISDNVTVPTYWNSV